MLDAVPMQIFLISWGAILALIGVVWRGNERQVADIRRRVDAHDKLDAHISSIQTDLKWIRASIEDIKHCKVNR